MNIKLRYNMKYGIRILVLFLFVSGTFSLSSRDVQAARRVYKDPVVGECGDHKLWHFTQPSGYMYIRFVDEDANQEKGRATLTVSGLGANGGWYYTSYNGKGGYSPIVNLSLNGNPYGLTLAPTSVLNASTLGSAYQLGANQSHVRALSPCSDCGNPYFVGFAAGFSYNMPNGYKRSDTNFNDIRLRTQNLSEMHWPNHSYNWDMYASSGASTVTNNSFSVVGATYGDLALGYLNGTSGQSHTWGAGTVTIYLERISYIVSINPDVGTWQGKSGISYLPSQKWGYNHTNISNPVASPYTVTLNPNGGTGGGTRSVARPFTGWTKGGEGTLSGTTFTVGIGAGGLKANYITNSTILPTLTRSGWTHLGWSKNKNAISETYANRSSYTPEGNETLFAIWKKDITLTYNPNGGTGEPSPETKTVYNSVSGASFIISNIAPIRKGYTFLHWEKEGGSGKYYSGSSYIFSENTTLVAIWENNLGVNATITRRLPPHEPVFKKGETGVLTIHTTGYAEKVNVSFASTLYPAEEYNAWYTLNSSEESWGSESTFIIPLYCEEGEYIVEVIAYRGEQYITTYPSLKIKGTVLDELRTRIRKN